MNHVLAPNSPLLLWVKKAVFTHHSTPRVFAESPNKGFLDRLVLGRNTPLTPEQKSLLNRTGTRHLLAISGLHVGLLSWFGALCFGGVGRLIALRWKPRTLRLLPALGGFLSALAYASNAGFPTSTIRALCMVTLGWCCWVFYRTIRPWRFWGAGFAASMP